MDGSTSGCVKIVLDVAAILFESNLGLCDGSLAL